MNKTVKKIIVTGGAGFIGSCLVRQLIRESQYEVLVYDALTYAGTLTSLKDVLSSPRLTFVQGEIQDTAKIADLFASYQPDIIMNLAAESHVDRSIEGPARFVETNILGTFALLDASLKYFRTLTEAKKSNFRFHHISTDEVFGSLGAEGFFREETAYDPRSPYSSSKAASDHLVMAWFHTYGLPVLLTNCSNNYGPYQFPEKLIPLVTLNALDGKELPIYGDGSNIRDWLYVEDHAKALVAVVERGTPGGTYVIGGNQERTNLQVVHEICAVLDEISPNSSGSSYLDQIVFVTDRPGHDARYAIDAGKIKSELGWQPVETFRSGLMRTIQWYLNNEWWWGPLRKDVYGGERLGIKP